MVLFQSKVYRLSKNVHKSYHTQPYKASPRSMIHSDIREPSRIKDVTSTRWSMSFVDNHTRTIKKNLKSIQYLEVEYYCSNPGPNKNTSVEHE